MTTDRKRGYLYILLAAMLYSTTEVALKATRRRVCAHAGDSRACAASARLALMPFALNDLKKRDIQLTKRGLGLFHTARLF